MFNYSKKLLHGQGLKHPAKLNAKECVNMNLLKLPKPQLPRKAPMSADNPKEKFKLPKRYGVAEKSVWEIYRALAYKYKPVNLGSGFPNFAPPKLLRKAFSDAVNSNDFGMHQYTDDYRNRTTPILIKNGTIVNENNIIEADVYLENGIIKEISKDLCPCECTCIDAQDKLVIPGGIDPHTHFEFEFMGTTSVDDFYLGTRAAIAGGTTTIIDFAFPKQGESLLSCYCNYRERAHCKACCDYGLHMCLLNISESTKQEMEILCQNHGVNSFKMFMAYSFRLKDEDLYDAFDHCKKLGAIPQVHAENGAIIEKNIQRLLSKKIIGPEGHELSRPEEVEAEAVNRACVIAKQVDSPLYVVHVMSKSAAMTLKRNCQSIDPNSNTKIFGETLVAGLGADGSHYKNKDFHHAAGYILSPPLRPDSTTPLCLMHCLANDILQLTGSDNCTFNKAQKELGKSDFTKIPNGVNGVEDRMSVVWEKGVHSGIIDPKRFVAITSTNAAKIFNLFPRKGVIAVGSDADLVVWNGQRTRTISAKSHEQAVDFNIFEGMICHGVPEYVIVNGCICVDDGILKVEKGHGRFVPTPVFSPFVYSQC